MELGKIKNKKFCVSKQTILMLSKKKKKKVEKILTLAEKCLKK